MAQKNEDPGQKWRYTGERCLLNGTMKYLTATDQGLVFLPRDHDDLGQQWTSDWHPTSVLYKNQAIDIYGGKNQEGATVGLYPCQKSPNEEWRRETDDMFLGRPECIGIKYDTDNIIFSSESPKLESVVHTTDTNHGSETIDGELEWEETEVRSTTKAHNVNASFSAEFKKEVEAEGGLPFVAKGKCTVGVTLKASTGYAFTHTDLSSRTKRQKLTRKFKIPPHKRVVYSMMARRVECRIPYTMTFDDGSTISDFLIHKDSIQAEFDLVESDL